MVLDRAVADLADALGGRPRIVVTADHGGLDAGPDQIHVLGAADRLSGLLQCGPSGDSRVVYFHVREGREPEFEDAFRERFGGRFFLLAAEEAEEMRLLGPGPLSGEVRRRVGSFVAVSRGADVMLFGRAVRSGPALVGYHSGLTPAEMLIPLIVA